MSRLDISLHCLNITVPSNRGGSLTVGISVMRRPSRQTVDISVAHAKNRGNQYGVVYLQVGCALLPRPLDVRCSHLPTTLLHLTRNRKKCLQFR